MSREAARSQNPSLHESRRVGETSQQFRIRLVEAREVCRTCSVFAACLRLLDDCREGLVSVDGILAGEPVRHRDPWEA